VLTGSSHAVDHDSTRAGRWLRARRFRASLWIAAVESILVAILPEVTKWTVVVIAIVAVVAWWGGRESRSDVIRNVLWIFAASQLLALIAVILGFIVKWAAILALVVFAIVGLLFLFRDRR
jgi:hypothetical protein